MGRATHTSTPAGKSIRKFASRSFDRSAAFQLAPILPDVLGRASRTDGPSPGSRQCRLTVGQEELLQRARFHLESDILSGYRRQENEQMARGHTALAEYRQMWSYILAAGMASVMLLFM